MSRTKHLHDRGLPLDSQESVGVGIPEARHSNSTSSSSARTASSGFTSNMGTAIQYNTHDRTTRLLYSSKTVSLLHYASIILTLNNELYVSHGGSASNVDTLAPVRASIRVLYVGQDKFKVEATKSVSWLHRCVHSLPSHSGRGAVHAHNNLRWNKTRLE